MVSNVFSGSSLIIDPTAKPVPSDFFIAESEGYNSVIFKKYRVLNYTNYRQPDFELISLDPDFPKITSTENVISIIGVAVIHVQSLK